MKRTARESILASGYVQILSLFVRFLLFTFTIMNMNMNTH